MNHTNADSRCTAMAAQCQCAILTNPPHDEHVCECGGRWTGELGTPNFRVFALPAGTPVDDTTPPDPWTLLRNMADAYDYREARR